MEEALLKLREVRKGFGGVQAVDRVSLDVKTGSITGLVGPNGSGKTTLLNVISGVHKAEEGSIFLNDARIDGLAPHQIFAKGLACAFQIPRLFYRLSVLDNMLLAARGHRGENLPSGIFSRRGWQKKETELAYKALEILKLLELDHLALSPTGELSGGQRKLLGIGRALMSDPTLLLLDEPTAGVNPVLGNQIYQKIKEFSQKGLSFLVIEHRLETLFNFASFIYVMDKGKIAIEDTPEKVINSPVFYEVYLGGG